MASTSEIKDVDEIHSISYFAAVLRSNSCLVMRSLRVSFSALLATASLGACGGGDDDDGIDEPVATCAEDTRDDEFVAGIEKTGGAGFTLALVDSLPAPPQKGDNRWSLELRDPSGALMPGYTLESAASMPDHGHGSPIEALVTDDGDGIYTLNPVNFFMPGYWETTITVVDPGETESEDDDTDIDTVVFKFCIDG